jgi:hypothetical protein
MLEQFNISETDIDHFIEFGYTLVRDAFDRDIGIQCREYLWKKLESEMNIDRYNDDTWVEKVKIAEIYGIEHGKPWSNLLESKRVGKALKEVCGEENINLDCFGAGWWTITFPINNDNSQWCVDGSWHIDGHNYTHYPYNKNIGVILIMFFSDVKENGGKQFVYIKHLL